MPSVLVFPAAPNPLDRHGIIVVSPTRESKAVSLTGLYERASEPSPIGDDDRAEFARLFRADRTVRRVAMNARTPAPPLGFAMAAPATSAQELANALRIDQIPKHVRGSIEDGAPWFLIVSVSATNPGFGIGRALANQALSAMRSGGARHVFVAAGASETSLIARLRDAGFSVDAASSDRRRVLLSRNVDFTF